MPIGPAIILFRSSVPGGEWKHYHHAEVGNQHVDILLPTGERGWVLVHEIMTLN